MKAGRGYSILNASPWTLKTPYHVTGGMEWRFCYRCTNIKNTENSGSGTVRDRDNIIIRQNRDCGTSLSVNTVGNKLWTYKLPHADNTEESVGVWTDFLTRDASTHDTSLGPEKQCPLLDCRVYQYDTTGSSPACVAYPSTGLLRSSFDASTETFTLTAPINVVAGYEEKICVSCSNRQ